MAEEKSELRSALEGKKKRGRLGWIIGAVVLVLALVGGTVLLVNTLGGEDDAVAGQYSVRIGVSEDRPFRDTVTEVAAEKGLTVEWVNLNDWVLPNTQLVDGEIDGNMFQHLLFLRNYNVQNNQDLVPVFSTQVVRWGIFSATLDSVDDLQDGDTIAIPNDIGNGGRALLILESAGLIEVDDEAGIVPTVDDVTANEKNLQFQAIEATSIPQQYDDPSLAAVVVGGNYFDPSQGISMDDALYGDDPNAETILPYVNAIVTRQDNADDPAWGILREAFLDERVKEAYDAEFFGTSVLIDVPREDLEAELADLVETAQQ